MSDCTLTGAQSFTFYCLCCCEFTVRQIFLQLITWPLCWPFCPTLWSPALKTNLISEISGIYTTCSLCSSLCSDTFNLTLEQLLHTLVYSTFLHTVYNDMTLKWILRWIQKKIKFLLLGFVCFLPVALLLIEWTEKSGDLGLIIPPTPTPPRHSSSFFLPSIVLHKGNCNFFPAESLNSLFDYRR